MPRFAAVLACLVALPFAALADPPGRVGRLAIVEGEASVYADPDAGWEGARINVPLTSENSLWTEPGSRAEIDIGSTALRLGEATQLDIVRLDDQTLRAHVARGTLAVRIRDLDRGESYFISTPQARLKLRGPGRYRVDADLDRAESRITVFSGSAVLEAAGGSIAIDAGRSVRVTGGARAAYEFEPANSSALDDWALAREARLADREAARYVPPEMTGWEDLDDYGVWRSEPDYGAVWFPAHVEAGWAPYRYGHWTWVRPWGWTWVDDAPWGYAPFHYGRWVQIGDRWGWYPGHYTSRPVWAPALVAWVGQPGWSVSVSTGSTPVVGWYPLSPFDRYQPWYAANPAYVSNVNHIVIPPRRDRERRDDRRDEHFGNRDRGATVVAREQFIARRPVQNHMAPVTREVVAAQPVVSGSVALPSRQEWRSRQKPAPLTPSLAAPRAPVVGEPVVERRQAPPGTRAPGVRANTPPVITPAVPANPARSDTPPPRYTRPAPAEPSAGIARPAEQRRPEAATGVARPTEQRRPEPAAGVAKPADPRRSEPRAPHVVEHPSPAPAKPVAKPAPAPERPARNVEHPQAPVEKPPPKPVDTGGS